MYFFNSYLTIDRSAIIGKKAEELGHLRGNISTDPTRIIRLKPGVYEGYVRSIRDQVKKGKMPIEVGNYTIYKVKTNDGREYYAIKCGVTDSQGDFSQDASNRLGKNLFYEFFKAKYPGKLSRQKYNEYLEGDTLTFQRAGMKTNVKIFCHKDTIGSLEMGGRVVEDKEMTEESARNGKISRSTYKKILSFIYKKNIMTREQRDRLRVQYRNNLSQIQNIKKYGNSDDFAEFMRTIPENEKQNVLYLFGRVVEGTRTDKKIQYLAINARNVEPTEEKPVGNINKIKPRYLFTINGLNLEHGITIKMKNITLAYPPHKGWFVSDRLTENVRENPSIKNKVMYFLFARAGEEESTGPKKMDIFDSQLIGAKKLGPRYGDEYEAQIYREPKRDDDLPLRYSKPSEHTNYLAGKILRTGS